MKDLTNDDFRAWPNFTRDEMVCKCGCNRCCMDPDFMDTLQSIRHEFGGSLTVSSGYRCAEHNEAVSDSGKTGAHTQGKAADLLIRGADAVRLLSIGLRHGITGVGVSQKGANRFLHLDTCSPPDMPRPSIWSY